jgi:hypothetical protein
MTLLKKEGGATVRGLIAFPKTRRKIANRGCHNGKELFEGAAIPRGILFASAS